ncbi:hypothetical protein J6590_019814 [Homalodisca vitripennis]|nr:hypothetical protein J6590_019814 [Homalodisca vitripennis]
MAFNESRQIYEYKVVKSTTLVLQHIPQSERDDVESRCKQQKDLGGQNLNTEFQRRTNNIKNESAEAVWWPTNIVKRFAITN